MKNSLINLRDFGLFFGFLAVLCPNVKRDGKNDWVILGLKAISFMPLQNKKLFLVCKQGLSCQNEAGSSYISVLTGPVD